MFGTKIVQMRVVYFPMVLTASSVNVMQESERMNTSKGKVNSQVRKFKKEKEVTAKTRKL